MVRHAHLFGRFGQSRRWFRRLLWAFLILGVGIAATGYYLTRPRRLAALTGALLSEMAGAPVRVGRAQFTFDGLIHLHDVALDLPPGVGASPQAEIFNVEEVVVRHDMRSLLHGEFRLRSLVLVNPTLFLTEDAATGKFGYQLLPRKLHTGEHSIFQELPEVQIHGGRLRFGEVDTGQYNELGVIHFSGALAPQSDKAGAYRFALQQEKSGGETGPVLHGTFDLIKFAVAAKLEGFTFESPQRMILPHRFRQWWDRLEPAGTLSTSFAYDPGIGFYIRIDVRDGQITLPYGEAPSRMTDVTGRFTITRDAVAISGLSGKIQGLSYVINAHIGGLDANAPFTLQAHIGPFDFTPDAHTLPNMPENVRRTFQRFEPSGTLEADVTLERSVDQGKPRLSYSGEAHLSHASAKYFRFPYPMQDLHGKVTFSDERVDIVDMIGTGPHGGHVVVNGQVAPPGEGAAVNIQAVATDFPVDELLNDALEPKHRKVVGLFTDQKNYQELMHKGLIQSSDLAAQRRKALGDLQARRRELAAAKPADAAALGECDKHIGVLTAELARPVFDLGGRVTLGVDVTRPLGPDKKFNTIVDIDVAGGAAVLTHWPYPLLATKGHIHVEHNRAVCTGIEAHGLTGAMISGAGVVDGNKESATEPGSAQTAIHVKASGVPIDQFLVASIPPPQDKWLADLGLDAKVDVTGEVTRNSAGDVEIDMLAHGVNGRARPMGGRYDLDRLSLTARIQRKQIDITQAQAYHAQTRFDLVGATHWIDGKPAFDITVDTTDLKIDDPIFDLLPAGEDAAERLRKIVDDHKLRGVVDGHMVYHSKPKDRAARGGAATNPAPQTSQRLPGSGPRELGVSATTQALRQAQNAAAPRAFAASTRPATAPTALAAATTLPPATAPATRPADTTEENYSVDIRPHWLGFQLHDTPVELKDAHGHLTMDHAGLRLDHLAAAIGSGHVAINGHVSASGNEADLDLDVSDSTFQGMAAGLFPPGVRKALAHIELDGAYHLHDAHLVYRAHPSKGQNTADITAKVDLDHAKASIGVPLTNAKAAISLTAALPAINDWPRVDMTLHADHLDIVGRRVAPLSLRLVTSTAVPSQLAIPDLSGVMYGGALVGSGRVSLEKGGDYDLSLTLQDINLDPILHPGPPAPPGPPGHPGPPALPGAATQGAEADDLVDPGARSANWGLVSAGIRLQGATGDPAHRRGRGDIDVHDAHLFNLPIGLGLLQIMSLSLPTSSSFDRAVASFLIDGQTMRFESIRFEAPTVRIVGDGKMDLKSRQLDVDFYARNPAALPLGPLGDLLHAVRDELITIHVGGTLNKPRMSLRSLTGIRQSWEDIFGRLGAPDRTAPATAPSPTPVKGPAAGGNSGGNSGVVAPIHEPRDGAAKKSDQ